MYKGLIDKYRDRITLAPNAKIISLHEGNTPLIPLNNLTYKLNLNIELYVKCEGANPTGSFKDRGMTVAISQAVAEGSRAVICASTGNTSAAAAAYAARAGISAFVLIPEGKIALGKLAQALIHGAHVLQIQGNFDEGLALVKQAAQTIPITIVNSINPYRIQGQKTAAFEVIEQLGSAPDYHALPVGNAANIGAYWLGYCEYLQDGLIAKAPHMLGYQASGSAPFLRGHGIDTPETIATAIRIGHPQSWDRAWQTQRESQGWFAEISDEQILQAQKLLAETEGIFCEPASAASIAGVLQDVRLQKIPPKSRVVCTLTGHGLKDPDTAISQTSGRISVLKAELEGVAAAITQMI